MYEISSKDDLLKQGIASREMGDYAAGNSFLYNAFYEAAVLRQGTDVQKINATNQYSIMLRLLAGRAKRTGATILAATNAFLSLRIYKYILSDNLKLQEDPGTIRNISHALLYAGIYDLAEELLKYSHSIQSGAGKGDELAHLAALYLTKGDISNAATLLEHAFTILREFNLPPIPYTFALMTKASLESALHSDNTTSLLIQAENIANCHNLAPRLEELTYMRQGQASFGHRVNVLDAVGVDLNTDATLPQTREVITGIIENKLLPLLPTGKIDPMFT